MSFGGPLCLIKSTGILTQKSECWSHLIGNQMKSCWQLTLTWRCHKQLDNQLPSPHTYKQENHFITTIHSDTNLLSTYAFRILPMSKATYNQVHLIIHLSLLCVTQSIWNLNKFMHFLLAGGWEVEGWTKCIMGDVEVINVAFPRGKKHWSAKCKFK